jgi:NitT/TauT family transport system substrate-binding protein
MKRSTTLRILAAPIVAGAVASRAQGAGTVAVRVAYEPLNTLTAFYAAIDIGLFQRAGLSVERQSMGSGPAMAAAIVSGALDFGVVNVLSLAQAHEKNVPLIYVAPSSLYASASPADALLVPNGSPIAGGRDLNGKTIAVNVLKGLAYLGTRAWIDKNGGDSATARFTEMPFDAMPAALSSHLVDAAFVAEPSLQRAKADARVLSYAYDALAPVFLISSWVGSTPWVAGHLDVARRFNDALLQAELWADHNPERAMEISARVLKVDAATLRSLSHAPYPEKRSAIALAQPVLDAAARYGALASAVPAAELFSRDVLR